MGSHGLSTRWNEYNNNPRHPKEGRKRTMRNTLRKPLATITMITAIGMLTPATIIPTAYATDNTAVTVAAADQLTQAQAKLDAAKQDVNTKQAAVNQATKERDDAKTAYEQALKDNQGGGTLTPEQQVAQTQLAKGFYGFLQQEGSPAVKDLITNDPTFKQWVQDNNVNLNNVGANSSFSFDNVSKSLDLIDQTNQVREAEGQSMVTVTDYLMAGAAISNEKVIKNYAHTNAPWAGSENIADGCGIASITCWATDEKKFFDQYAQSDSELAAHRYDSYWVYVNRPDIYQGNGNYMTTGHYLNIMDRNNKSVGVGFGQHPSGYQDTTLDTTTQQFRSDEKGAAYTVAEFRAKLDAYVSKLKQQAGSTGSQTAVDTAKKKLDEAQRKLDQAQQALDAAQRALEQAQKEYDEIKNNNGGSTSPDANGLIPVYRLYNPNMPQAAQHLYTTDRAEYDSLPAHGWIQEGAVFNAAETANSQPVYRVYNPYTGAHHYTRDANEYHHLTATGWNDENIGWYLPANATQPVYRAYNHYTGEHLYTMQKVELLNAVNNGWTDEGIAFNTIA